MIEFKSVARGLKAADEMVKKAPIRILETHPVCPGKYMVLIGGEVADVQESMAVGIKIGGDMVVSDFILPQAHTDLIPAITGTTRIKEFGAIGIIETFSIASCIEAADIAAKASPIKLIEIRLANGLGGKAFFVMTGELNELEISLERAKEFVARTGMLAGCELIAAPHADLIEKGVYW